MMRRCSFLAAFFLVLFMPALSGAQQCYRFTAFAGGAPDPRIPPLLFLIKIGTLPAPAEQNSDKLFFDLSSSPDSSAMVTIGHINTVVIQNPSQFQVMFAKLADRYTLMFWVIGKPYSFVVVLNGVPGPVPTLPLATLPPVSTYGPASFVSSSVITDLAPRSDFSRISIDSAENSCSPELPFVCGKTNLRPAPPNGEGVCGDAALPFHYVEDQFFHSYIDSTEVCKAGQSPGCTVEKVFAIMLRTPPAIGPVASSVLPHEVHSCETFQMNGNCRGFDNKVKVIIDSADHSITNYTSPTHIFYPGQVTRQIVNDDGVIRIKTTGTGVGCYRILNVVGAKCKIWPEADQALRIAVWGELGLGNPPDITTASQICRLAVGAGMEACDRL